MAESLMSKSNMFSPSASSLSSINHPRNQFQQSISMLPNKLSCKSALFSSAIRFQSLKLRSSSCSDFHGRRFAAKGLEGVSRKGDSQASSPQMSIGFRKAQKWWEKGLQPNMKEVEGAQDLVDSLKNAGDKLVVVGFFSPGCGGCRALHPKLCQLAEMNPDVQFLHVNYEEHKSMSYSLNVHVLPFFRFYRGAQGRLCSFSCTNATIKKFKDALAKHGPDRCSLGPTKGLEEKELLALSANRDLDFTYTPKTDKSLPVPSQERVMSEATSPVPAPASSDSDSGLPLPLPLPLPAQDPDNKSLVASGR